MSKQKVRKAVIAAAGFGTRFLPQTKAMPKEMLPLVDKPIIQHIVEELVGAGIEDIVIVTGYHKRAIEDHFDQISADLANNLQAANKTELLAATQKISELANFVYIRQKGPYGSATPVLNSAHLIGDEPFIYAFADDFFQATPSRFKQMIDLYEKNECSVLPCIRVTDDAQYSRYGIVSGDEVTQGQINVKTIVEKPGKDSAPSNLASVGGYLFEPAIFDCLQRSREELLPDKEFLVQPGMQMLIDAGKKILAFEVKNGTYYDTGEKLEYIKTLIDFSLQRDDMRDELTKFIRTRLNP